MSQPFRRTETLVFGLLPSVNRLQRTPQTTRHAHNGPREPAPLCPGKRALHTAQQLAQPHSRTGIRFGRHAVCERSGGGRQGRPSPPLWLQAGGALDRRHPPAPTPEGLPTPRITPDSNHGASHDPRVHLGPAGERAHAAAVAAAGRRATWVPAPAPLAWPTHAARPTPLPGAGQLLLPALGHVWRVSGRPAAPRRMHAPCPRPHVACPRHPGLGVRAHVGAPRPLLPARRSPCAACWSSASACSWPMCGCSSTR